MVGCARVAGRAAWWFCFSRQRFPTQAKMLNETPPCTPGLVLTPMIAASIWFIVTLIRISIG
jgi:hypothetical protein